MKIQAPTLLQLSVCCFKCVYATCGMHVLATLVHVRINVGKAENVAMQLIIPPASGHNCLEIYSSKHIKM